jgi:hypothetical protein
MQWVRDRRLGNGVLILWLGVIEHRFVLRSPVTVELLG